MYDLAGIVKRTAKRKRPISKVIRVRTHTLTQERQLLFIYQRITAFWSNKVRTLEPALVFADAAPDPYQIQQAGYEADLLVAEMIRMLREWAIRSADWVMLTWIQRVRAETGVDIAALATNQAGHAKVQASVEWATALIKDLSDETRNKLVSALSDITLRGVPESEAAPIIQEVLKASKRRAEMIARDQTQKIVAQLNEAQQAEAGVTEYIWQHSFLPNARRHHVERQGQRFSWAKPPRDGHPGYAINCRCTAAAVLEA